MTMLQKIYAVLNNIFNKPLDLDDVLSKLQEIVDKPSAGNIISSSTKITVIATGSFPSATDVLLAAANPNRKGFSIYNNSTSSMYVGVGIPASASTQIGQCASNAGPTAHFYSGQLGNFAYTGPLYGRRNAGSGSAWCVEFE